MTILRTDTVSGIGGRNAITGSVEFITSYGYLSTTLDAIGTSDFTIEWWFKAENRTEPGTANRRMFRLGANNATGSISINYDAVNNDIQWNYDAYTLLAASTIKVYDNSWYHIAAVREGTGSNETKLYINGVLSDTGTLATDFTQTALQIGWDSTLGDAFGFYGNISNLRVTKRALYTAAFTPPTEKLRGVVDTILLCCQDSNDVTVDAVGNTITSHGNSKATKITPSVGVDAGVTFDGDTKINSQGVMYFPTGDTSQRGRGRGVFAGGYTSVPSNAAVKRIYYIQIDSMGTSAEFGDTNKAAAWGQSGCSSSTRGLFTGGTTPTNLNTIDYITIATTSNALDFGDLSISHGYTASCSNNTRGLTGGGRGGSPTARLAQIDYNTIATLGNGQDFGDLTQSRMGLGAVASSTRAVFTGGNGSPADPSTVYNIIDYVEFATTGNATDFGDMTDEHTYHGSCSSSTRGIIYGGVTSYGPTVTTDIIEYVTIASTGNGTDFGNVRDDGAHAHGTSNSIRGVFAGGVDPYRNSIDFVTISTTGNGVDWGDLPDSNGSYAYAAGLSDSHGGLS